MTVLTEIGFEFVLKLVSAKKVKNLTFSITLIAQ